MNECNSIKNNSVETIDKINLSEETKFRLDGISKIENYFIEKINQRKSCSQKLNKYVTTFDYIDKILIFLSATTGRVSLISFTSVNGAPVGIASASFSLTRKKKKKKHDKIFMLAKSKLNNIDTLKSQALTDMDISHEEFITILK